MQRKLDLSTIGGLVVAVAGILGGLILEGGKFADIGQVTAALIVMGGTLGAVLVTTPFPLFRNAVKKLTEAVWDSTPSNEILIEQILDFGRRARKNGIVSLDSDAERVSDPFLRKALMLAVDGTDLQDLRRIMELEIRVDEARREAEAKVFESAGGYAPTIGIIGAVLGLIQVMKHLEDIELVGHGIAVAFVATVYGVGLANLVFLPIANKLKLRMHESLEAKELSLEGVISIAEGLHPNLIRSKLEAYTRKSDAKEPSQRRIRRAA